MLIKVEQKHIDEGIRFSAEKSPIVLAAREQIFKNLEVFQSDSELLVVDGWCYREYALPDRAVKFLEDFDRDYRVKPFAFEIAD